MVIMWLNSPTTHSGKSELLSVLWTICYKALEPQLEPTSAALFRFPSVIGGTLLLDKVDNLDPQKRSEVISILNHYHSNGVVIRATPGKDRKFTLEKLHIYCPKVIAGINKLPTTLQDRCIKTVMHRKRRSEKVDRFMPGSFEATEPLRNQLDMWAARDGLRILTAYQNHTALGVPNDIDDRGRDILEPLFAVASVLPAWVTDKLTAATVRIAKERTYEEQESNTVIQGLEILKLHFPRDKSVWNLRTESALELFEEVTGIETWFSLGKRQICQEYLESVQNQQETVKKVAGPVWISRSGFVASKFIADGFPFNATTGSPKFGTGIERILVEPSVQNPD
jgi:Protein of unknown function (DUF3631)